MSSCTIAKWSAEKPLYKIPNEKHKTKQMLIGFFFIFSAKIYQINQYDLLPEHIGQ